MNPRKSVRLLRRPEAGMLRQRSGMTHLQKPQRKTLRTSLFALFRAPI
jgi:hypothetical protein